MGFSESAEYVVRKSPKACLDEAAAYMARAGYHVETRTASFVTLSRAPKIDGMTACLIVALGLLTFGVTVLALLVLYNIKWRVTVLALPHERGSRVTITTSVHQARETLEGWVASLGADARPI